MTADELRGRRLGGFELTEPLGEGSFGSVWRARQIRLDRDVAVKVLDPLVARDPVAARRFEREGRAAASLDHPSIVPVYEAGDDDGLYYLAMRLVDGETLAAAIDREAPMLVERVVAVLTPIAAALDAAHATGLIHRDVKPANILIEDGRPYLGDFGIAASARELGRYTTGSIGTAEYMSPEQARGEPVDHRSDLYALGCVAYHALTGRSPFARQDVVSTLMAHSTDELPSVGDQRLDDFFTQALAKEAAGRFASGAELIAAMSGSASAGERPASPTPARSGRPRRSLIAAAACVVVLVIGALAFARRADAPSAATTTAITNDSTPSVDEEAEDSVATAAPEPSTVVPSTQVAADGVPVSSEVPAAASALRRGGSVAVGTTLDLSNPNPHASRDAAKILAEWTLPVMYRIDAQLDPEPSLATGPPRADPDDPLVLTWSIRDDRSWEDGTPVTTADIVATHEYLVAADTSAVSTSLYDSVATVTALDATTVQLQLSEPNGAAYLLFSTIHPIIKNAAWREHLGRGETAATFLVDGVDFAAGPYQLAARQNPGEIALARNPGWTGDEVALDRVDFAFYPDSAALVEAQQSGQVDVIWVDDVDRTEVRDAEALADTTVLTDASDIAVQLSMNLRSEPLMDPLVRRAILHAIDRAAVADTAVGRKTGTNVEPWNSLVFAPDQRGNDQPFADIFDVDEANRLLDEAGWLRPDETVFRRKDGQDLALTIVLLSDSDSINTAIAIEEALQGIGIDITGTPASSEFTSERMNAGAFDLLLQFRVFNNDPVATALSFATDACPVSIEGCSGDGVNFGAFSSAEVDAVFDQVDRINDPLERRNAYAEIDRLLLDAVPAVPLYVEPAFSAHRDDIAGIVMAPNVGPMSSLDDWGFLADS
ncbi:MAG: ABC transporter substrate-binding protein [Ilumatobacter sp.]